ncbi:FtsQ-type POTRA domain-containing protein, partial [Acinetobacter baumannii]|nr:FtsQ-type POTRA domain-containing protein [Acinetobacter baumannii]
MGQNLFRFNSSKAEDELLKYPYVQKAEISRHFPHRLEINITERQPAGVLLNNSNYLQFSKDGILLDNT